MEREKGVEGGRQGEIGERARGGVARGRESIFWNFIIHA